MSYIPNHAEVVDHLRRHTEARKRAAEAAVAEATGQEVDSGDDGDSQAGG